MIVLKIQDILKIVIVFCLITSCKNDDDMVFPPISITSIPDTITINDPGLYPTKFDFDYNTNQFIVGSALRSNVGFIKPETGNYEVFIKDDSLATVTEVYVDKSRNRLLVTSGDFGISANSKSNTTLKLAYLGIYNLTTGKKIKGVNLHELLPEGSIVLPNGMTTDALGNIYVVDTYSPVIYKIDGSTFKASIFIQNERFITRVPKGRSPGLIGLVYVNNYLIASKEDEGILFKIPINNPNTFSKVAMPTFEEVKGLELLKNGNIALTVSGSITPFSGVKIVSSKDNWSSAVVESSFEVLPKEKHPVTTTLASNNQLYVINSYLPKAPDLKVNFSILKVKQ